MVCQFSDSITRSKSAKCGLFTSWTVCGSKLQLCKLKIATLPLQMKSFFYSGQAPRSKPKWPSWLMFSNTLVKLPSLEDLFILNTIADYSRDDKHSRPRLLRKRKASFAFPGHDNVSTCRISPSFLTNNLAEDCCLLLKRYLRWEPIYFDPKYSMQSIWYWMLLS